LEIINETAARGSGGVWHRAKAVSFEPSVDCYRVPFPFWPVATGGLHGLLPSDRDGNRNGLPRLEGVRTFDLRPSVAASADCVIAGH
jgi:hypothetical protein